MEKTLLQNLCPELSTDEIVRVAKESGFSKRIEKKFRPWSIYHSSVRNLSKGQSATMTSLQKYPPS
jgi:hypothetical protein